MSKPGESELPPDRLCVDPKSPFFNEAVLARGIGIRFKGKQRFDVEEYCRSEGWIRAPIGKTRDRKGNPLMVKLTGEVEAFFQSPGEETSGDETSGEENSAEA